MPSITIKNNEKVIIKDSCTLILSNNDINIEYNFKNGNYNVLIFADFNNEIDLKDFGEVINSNVKINYLMLDKTNLKQYSKVNVNKDSSLNINTTYLGVNKKDITFDLYNLESDSLVEINNNIVCLDSADFSLECIGTIVKGAKRSKCHQKSHCLTMENPLKAKVLPVLNIDENDVEASHSLSSGTIDEEILFYMNTRGLDSKEALSLILKSYLMPNENYYDEFIDGKIISDKAITKVEEICSM